MDGLPISEPEAYSLLGALVKLPLAALLGAALALRPKRRGTPKRTTAVVQTQILLSVVGAVIMLVVGASLARAFGIVGAANLIRYRSKIEDPKDAVVMLCALAVGLASGVGLYALAVFSTAFLVTALWVIESFEPQTYKQFALSIKAGEADDARSKVEDVLRRHHLKWELRTLANDEIRYEVRVPFDMKPDPILSAIAAIDPKGQLAVEWDESKEKEGVMKLLVQPDDGATPLVNAIRHARQSVQIVVFRFDQKEIEKSLAVAVERGISVQALIANTNRGGEKRLRKLEQRLLQTGVTVSRTGDDLARYHGKMLIADDELFVLGFNFTKLDIERSRSFGVSTKDAKLVKAATALFESDAARLPYAPGDERLVISPENARETLSAFLSDAKKTICIYDIMVADRRMLKLLDERIRAGVEVRVIGKVKQPPEGLGLRKLAKLRLHARAIVCDGTRAFVGSQSLKKPELDQRREVGVIVTDAAVAKALQETFESDWENAKPKLEPAGSEEADAKAAS